MQNILKSCLIIGGNGHLGKSIVKNLKDTYKIMNIEKFESQQANANYLIDFSEPITNKIQDIYKEVEIFSQKLDLIVCVAGGFMMDRIKDKEIFLNQHIQQSSSVMSSLLAGHLAYKYLNPNGLLVLTGAEGVIKNPCPTMVSYALAKSAVHSINYNIAADQDFQGTVVTILPTVIDTPANREAMPKENFEKWLSVDGISGLIKMWSDGINRPKTGSMAILNQKEGSVVPEFI